MRRHIPLALPWLLLGTVTLAIIWDQVRTRDVEYVGSAEENASHRSVEDDSNNSTSVDPICSMEVRKGASDSVVFERQHYYFCSDYCVDEFKRNPGQYAAGRTNRPPPAEHTMRGIPTWMAQLGVGFVILISFGLFESLPVPLKRKSRQGSGLPVLNEVKGGHEVSEPSSDRFELTAWEPLRRLLQWQYLRSTVQAFFAAAFLVIIAAGLFGNQNPAMNVAPLLTWTIWWVGLVFLVLFLGKAWCYVCPWDAIATWMERLKFSGARKEGLGLQLEWPKSMRNIWPAVSLFVLLTWIELGAGITLIPRATAYVALAILGMTIVSTFLFERKAFCRYACLVGRISGLYSLFSSLELRTRDPRACASCKTSDCFKGNDNGDGCPTFEFPRTMELNTYCILCTECMKTCPHDNIGINLRPWGSDLVGQGKPRTDEAFLSLVLLSMTGFHGLTMTPRWTEWNESVQAALGLSQWFTFTLLMFAIMFAPILIFWALSKAAAVWSEHGTKRVFIRYAYALLPIALFYHLAHNAEHFLMEGPKIFALLSDPFGWGWDIFGTALWNIGPLVSLSGLWGIQVAMVILGHVYSLWIAARTTRELIPVRRAAFASQLPMLAAMILFSVFSLWLLHQPMQMRVSAM